MYQNVQQAAQGRPDQDDEPVGEVDEKTSISLSVVGVLFLCVLLYFQWSFYQGSLYGQNGHWIVTLFAFVGLFSACMMIGCTCLVSWDRQGTIKPGWCVVLVLFVLAGIRFMNVESLDYGMQAKLIQIDTGIVVRSSCPDSRLLHVTEILTYELEEGFVDKVIRTLDNMIEPANFTARGPADVGHVHVVPERFESSKTDIHYSGGQVTRLYIRFHDSLVSEGEGALRFVVTLSYNARLRGNGDSECGSLDEHGGSEGITAALGVCPVEGGNRKVEGMWSVPVCRVDAALPDVSVPSEWALVSVTPGVADEKHQQFVITVLAPADLQIGTETCPMAWELAPRNVFWYIGSLFLSAALISCLATIFVANDREGLPVAAMSMGLGACLLLTAGVFFAIGSVEENFLDTLNQMWPR